VEFSTGDTYLTIQTVSADGFQTHRDASAVAVRAAVAAFESARQTASDANIERASGTLYHYLLEPIAELNRADTLIIVPDDTTASVPFAMLRPSRQATFLAARKDLVIAPTATSAVMRRNIPAHAPRGNVVVIADPAFDSSRFPAMPRLASAAREGSEIVRLYKKGRVLSGHEATRREVEKAMKRFDVVDFATHAIADDRDGRFSSIVLAPSSGDPGAFYSAEIGTLRLDHHPIIVLAGCSTAAPGGGRGSIRNLSLAFLSAGSRDVVGTLWDVDDDVARAFSVRFHSALASGARPTAALRDAQLTMMQSHNSKLRSPTSWGAFQLYGYASSRKEH
jgi:CHAT domain-containing protein